eukprot:gnl/TRDRNA2_/TRDRNA2_133581_c0_seq1.p1 gnl/TRDRNA2_/TRDRNA2_133581_c0~~gnl/TRDRNA2_/TRDRNA2_133581_c0_seq1.p1  ORF type:complete len:416 (+),score=70.46 gnl/TRDRNA2_/TRDRNA2_133581_c0_seq1:101-1348(+)
MAAEAPQPSSVHRALRSVMVLFLAVLFSSNMIGLTAAKRAGGHENFQFEFVTVTLLQELLKLIIAAMCFWRECSSAGGFQANKHITLRLGTFSLYSVPALLYCFDNNFQYVVLGFLDPAELTVLWNFKIFATAVLLRTFLQQSYAWHQWGALATLVLGCAVTQASNGVFAFEHHEVATPISSSAGIAAATGSAASGQVQLISPKLIGACLAIIGSTIVAASNVFCEWLMKQSPGDSVNLQTMQLYFFGFVLNLVALYTKLQSHPESPANGPGGFFAGYTPWVWTVLLVGSVSGIAVSMTLKFVDNIAVVFGHAIAMVIVPAVSAEFFSENLSLPFLIGAAMVISSLMSFHSGQSHPVERLLGGESGECKALWVRPSWRDHGRREPESYQLAAAAGAGDVEVRPPMAAVEDHGACG